MKHRIVDPIVETYILIVATVLYLTTVSLDIDSDFNIATTASLHALLCICVGIMADPEVGMLRIALKLALTPIVGLVLRHYAGAVTKMIMLSISAGCMIRVSITHVFVREMEKPRNKWHKFFTFLAGQLLTTSLIILT